MKAGDAMTIQEVCQRLGKSESTIRRWIRSRKLTATKVEGINQIPESEVQALLSDMATDRSMTGELTGQDELIAELRAEVEYLRQELTDTKERSDTIILNLTRQLENQQRLLEYHQEPWYRRLFRKREQAE